VLAAIVFKEESLAGFKALLKIFCCAFHDCIRRLQAKLFHTTTHAVIRQSIYDRRMNRINLPADLLKKIGEGRCIAFVGSGMSVGAGLPTWRKLLENMITWCEGNNVNLPARGELQKLLDEGKFLLVAKVVVQALTQRQFHDLVVAEIKIPGIKPTELHRALVEIPFRAVLTSNYDTLIEDAYTVKMGSSPVVFTQLDLAELSRSLSNDEFYVFKNHGDIKRVDSIILTGQHYRDLIHGNAAYKIHIENVFTSNTVLFIGFSLSDPDLLGFLNELAYVFKNHTVTHYAILDRTSVTAIEIDGFRADYGIEVIPYTPSSSAHPEVLEILKELARVAPKPFLRHIEIARRDLEELDPHFRLVSNTKGEFGIEEKYPGAAEEGDLNFQVTITKEAFDAWKKFQDTGEEVTISGEHVASFIPPEIIQKAFGGEFKTSELTFGPSVTREKKKVRLRMVPVEGPPTAIDQIELGVISAGEKQIVLSNEGQDFFLKLKLTMLFDEASIKVEMLGTYVGVNVIQSMTLNSFFEAVEKGGELFIEYSDTGDRLGSTVLDSGLFHPQSEVWKRIIGALVKIQERTGVSFQTPESISPEQLKTISDTEQALDGHGSGSLTIEITLPREIAEKLAQERGKVQVTHTADFRPTILGKEVAVGVVWIKGTDMSLDDGESVRVADFLRQTPDAIDVTCTVRSAKDNGHAYYVDYLDNEGFETLFKDPTYRTSTLNELLDMIFDSAALEGVFDTELAINTFRVAKEQKNKFGRPYNILGRAEKHELQKALAPRLESLDSGGRADLINGLLENGVFGKDELKKDVEEE
jgi:hypothetical protein